MAYIHTIIIRNLLIDTILKYKSKVFTLRKMVRAIPLKKQEGGGNYQ